MKRLSLDQSTVKTGDSLFDNSDLYGRGVIDLHTSGNAYDRFSHIVRSISDMIQKTKPDALISEDVSLRNNAQTLILLSRIQGCLIQNAVALDIPYFTYSPTKWRAIMGLNQGGKIKRTDLKKQAVAFIKTITG